MMENVWKSMVLVLFELLKHLVKNAEIFRASIDSRLHIPLE